MSDRERCICFVVAFVVWHASLFGLGFVGAHDKGLDHALQLTYGSMGIWGILLAILLVIGTFAG